ncbi:MAG TPA: hypothetical protein VHN14_36605 [Kofleriaceae bacterium]|nr:hypothetical protein [Kofleriaceae bacterium]
MRRRPIRFAAGSSGGVRLVIDPGGTRVRPAPQEGAHAVGRPPAPRRPVLDALALREPDLSLYDQLVPSPLTRDPGTPATVAEDDHDP